ncbi:MAG: hypothetical protein HY907_15135 [Deltaproteobacteria bacterium]|nr:hypothetical protein [Deltaproteobacteria bacterium]
MRKARSGSILLPTVALAAIALLAPPPASAQPVSSPPPGDAGPPEAPAYEAAEPDAPEPPAPDCDAPTGFFMGLHALAYVPFGSWIDHPMAGTTTYSVAHPDDLDRFGPGGGATFELGAKWCPRLGFSIQVDVSSLGTDEWVDYANANLSSVSAWAAQWGLDSMILVEAVRADPFRLEARAGLGYRDGTGEERSADYDASWTYDFLRSGLSLRFGAGWLLSVLDGLDVVALTDFVMGFPGADDGELGDALIAWSFQLAVGVRFLPGEL